jgi:hypothetical protein
MFQRLLLATAGYFYDTFAYEIWFYGIYFYRISFYGIYFYKALKFFSIDCTAVRNTWKYKYTLKQKVKCEKNRF